MVYIIVKFLIDNHLKMVEFRKQQAPDFVIGQLLTPLTRYASGHYPTAIDNGCFGGFENSKKRFKALLKREYNNRDKILFVCVPDEVGNHSNTLKMWHEHNHIVPDGYKKAFVAQDGFNIDDFPEEASTIFIGGTDDFKDSREVLDICKHFKDFGIHVHIGRVNTPIRFSRFHDGDYADTCDGSGVSKFDGHIEAISRYYEFQKVQGSLL